MPLPSHATEPAPQVPAPGAGGPDPGLATSALAQLMGPLARLMIDHGLQLPAAVELLKKSLVDEAVASFGVDGKASTDTRVAVLTGVHRKDVRRLRELPAQVLEQAPMVSVAASVVARWISEPQFLNADRSPRPLARTPRHALAGEPDFSTLVAQVSRDVGARAVLDELLRLGAVELDDGVFARLKASAFVPQDSQRDAFHFLSANVGDHLAAAVHNVSPGRAEPPRLEQSAFSAGLSPAQAQELHDAARQLWGQALQQFLQAATQAEARSAGHEGPRMRVRFGTYFHQASEAAAVAQAPKPRRARKPAP